MVKQFKGFRKLVKYWQRHPIASKDMSGTIGRFFRWQLSNKLLSTPVVWSWIGESKLVIEKSMTGATMNIYCGLHEFQDMGFLLHLLRPEDRFVDVGANVGTYTVLASSVIGAKSLTIEPIPATYRKLLRNIQINDLQEKVTAKCCGVGAEDGDKLRFIADRDTTNRIAPANYEGETVEVPIVNLDALLENYPAVLWKIDVEGFEEQVIKGANKALDDPSLLAIEMEGDSETIRRIMQQKGFALYKYDPFSRQFQGIEGAKDSHNWLWVRDMEQVVERCQAAPELIVNGVKF